MADHDTSPSGQCPLMGDDRTLLLPPPPSSSSSSPPSSLPPSSAGPSSSGAEGKVAAAERPTQLQAKPILVDSSSDVYTITDDSLPSHMRSLLPSHEKHVHDLLTLERTRQRLRYVILALTAMLALTVVVAVTLVMSLKVTPGSTGMESGHFRMPFPLAKGVKTEVRVSLLDDRHNQQPSDIRTRYRHVGGPKSRRTPCVKECWSYAAFRFRSVCQDGLCLCRGENYDPYTCLPQYGKCQMEKRFPGQSSAKLLGKNQTTYVCHVPPNADHSVHVVSIFGNHKVDTTHVTVQNPSPSSKTLVLVNYHFVQWTVHLPENSGVTKVVVVSMKRSSQAERVIFLGPSSSNSPDVEVEHKLSLTGYGEDQHGGHTPRLLQFIDEQVGHVTTFLGASHAENIVLDLKENSLINTTTATSTESDI